MAKVSELMSNNIEWMKKNQQTWSIFYNMKEEGAKGDGVKDDKATLDKIITKLNGKDGVVIFPKGDYRIASNLTIPKNVYLYFVGEGYLVPDSGVTITINGGILAGPYQIFKGEGNTNGSKAIVTEHYPEWWGAKGDGITDDTVAITKTVDMASNSTILFFNKTYLVTDASLLNPLNSTVYKAEGTLSRFLYNGQYYPIPIGTALFSNGDNKVTVSIGGNVKTIELTGNELINMKNNYATMNERINSIIAHNGDGTKDTEIIDARGGASVLSERLNIFDSQLADISYNVKSFGAKGDGSNDTLAILSAVAFINANGGTLLFPSGTYLYTTTPKLLRNGVRIIGSGKDQTRLIADGCDGINMDSYYSSVTDLSLFTTATDKTGILLNKSYCKISSLYFAGYESNVDFWEKCIHASNTWNSQITNNDFMGGYGHVGYYGTGIYLDYCVNNQISLNHFEDVYHAIYSSSETNVPGGHYSEGIIITENLIISVEHGVYLNGGLFFNVSNNIIDQVKTKGILVNVAASVNINGNWISQYGVTNENYLGIHVAGGYNVSISNNDILTVQQNVLYGVKIDTNYNSVTGNTITNFDTGIYVSGDRNSLTGNVIQNAALYDIDLQGDHNQVNGNNISKLNINTSKTNNATQYDTFSTAIIVTTNGESSKTIDVSIPVGRFSSVPNVGIIMSSDYYNQHKIIGVYLYNDPANTPTNVRFHISSPSGNLPSGNYSLRLSVMLSK